MPAGAGKWMPALADLTGCDGNDVRHAHARLRRPLDAHIPPDHPARLPRPNLRYAARRAVPNISWEFIFSFLYPHGPVQRPVNIVWFSLDLVILFQMLRYGPSEFGDLSKRAFYAMFGLALATSFCAVLSVTYEFDDWDGAYSAFGQNLLMSVLFWAMLRVRGSPRGQSVSIALSKMLGTGLTSLAFYLYSPLSAGSILLPFLYVAIVTFDLIYVFAMARAQSTVGRGPRDRAANLHLQE